MWLDDESGLMIEMMGNEDNVDDEGYIFKFYFFVILFLTTSITVNSCVISMITIMDTKSRMPAVPDMTFVSITCNFIKPDIARALSKVLNTYSTMHTGNRKPKLLAYHFCVLVVPTTSTDGAPYAFVLNFDASIRFVPTSKANR